MKTKTILFSMILGLSFTAQADDSTFSRCESTIESFFQEPPTPGAIVMVGEASNRHIGIVKKDDQNIEIRQQRMAAPKSPALTLPIRPLVFTPFKTFDLSLGFPYHEARNPDGIILDENPTQIIESRALIIFATRNPISPYEAHIEIGCPSRTFPLTPQNDQTLQMCLSQGC